MSGEQIQMLKSHANAINKEKLEQMMPKESNYNLLHERHDVYAMVIKGFKIPYISFLYILGMIILGFHLNHAIQSMFQTLGWNHPKYNKFLRGIGPVLSIFIVICFISIPISIMLGLVGGGL